MNFCLGTLRSGVRYPLHPAIVLTHLPNMQQKTTEYATEPTEDAIEPTEYATELTEYSKKLTDCATEPTEY
ncbi:hypothetical protein DPMN_171583 [Dreissena polymorpha]|uniref:Uncharacterized protein n=1 Tax=Dreissena polymorpha TaxID=45954 RepID=A0A9D4IEA3_DREPO|nr:hypothetical protein DPMN_171583 [Dreissena polymorpha]